MTGFDDHLRKAAILIDTLDARSADALLEQMGEEQAARVRSAVMQLGAIGAAERDQVVREFMGAESRDDQPNAQPSEQAGVEVDESLAAKFGTLDSGQPVRPNESHERRLQKTDADAGYSASPESAESKTLAPFAFLHEASGEQVSKQLQDEHPQTMALVMAHLPPEKAADVLRRLPEDHQSEVLHRIALMNEMDPDVVREVGEHLHVLFANDRSDLDHHGAGREFLQAILDAADQPERDVMVERLARRDAKLASAVSNKTNRASPPSLSNDDLELQDKTPDAGASQKHEAISNRMPGPPATERTGRSAMAAELTFDDVSRLDDKAFAAVLRAAHPQVTLLALTGARREVVSRLLRDLPRAEAKSFMRKMERIGPLRLSDIEHAQQRLANIAADLASQGVIRIPPTKKRFAAAA